MALHKLAPIPEGYSVISFEKRFYPVAVNIINTRRVHVHTFMRPSLATVVFSKRSLAVQFLQNYAAGETRGTRIDFSTVTEGK